MSTRDGDEDPVYNRSVLKEIRASAHDREERSTEIKDIRTAIFRAINLLHIEVQALHRSVERWQWTTIAVIVLIILYIVIRR